MRILICMCAALLCAGCEGTNDNDRLAQTLLVLERGKASGQIILTLDGRASVHQSVEFGIGAQNGSLSFSGRVNFSDPLLRDKPEAANDEPPG